MNIKLTQSSIIPTVVKPNEIQWVLSIDDKPYPCAAKSVGTYNELCAMIQMAKNIEDITND